MNLDGSQKQLMMKNTDGWMIRRIDGKPSRIVLLGWRKSETFVSVLNLENGNLSPMLSPPGALYLTEDLVAFIPNSDWLVMTTYQNEQFKNILLNVTTGAMKEQGEGKFYGKDSSSFKPPIEVVFVRSVEDGKLEYRLFDKDGNVAQSFIVPNETYFIKTLSPDGRRIANQTGSIIGDIRKVSIIENHSETVKPITQRQITAAGTFETVSWTPDSKYLMVSQTGSPSAISPVDRENSMKLYDLDGRLLLTRYFDPTLFTAGAAVSPCAPEQLQTPQR